MAQGSGILAIRDLMLLLLLRPVNLVFLPSHLPLGSQTGLYATRRDSVPLLDRCLWLGFWLVIPLQNRSCP